jgi:hypothetical protein
LEPTVADEYVRKYGEDSVDDMAVETLLSLVRPLIGAYCEPQSDEESTMAVYYLMDEVGCRSGASQ